MIFSERITPFALQRQINAAVTIYTPVFLKNRGDLCPAKHIFVGFVHNSSLIIVTAFGHIKMGQQRRQCIFPIQGVDDHCLFAVSEYRQIDAGVFFKTAMVSFITSTSNCSS